MIFIVVLKKNNFASLDYFISTNGIKKRYSKKFRWHIEIADVENRSFILFHPANNAQKELNGCIAPVTKLSGSGLGLESRQAFIKLKSLVYKSLEREEKVLLIVKS